MSKNKLNKEFDPAGWQWQDNRGQIFQIEDLTRDDLLQVACACMDALENAEAACLEQQAIFSAWRTGRKLEAAPEIDRLLVSAEAELQSRRMFVARLEEISKHGGKAITALDVLAMISDCDFLAANQSA